MYLTIIGAGQLWAAIFGTVLVAVQWAAKFFESRANPIVEPAFSNNFDHLLRPQITLQK